MAWWIPLASAAVGAISSARQGRANRQMAREQQQQALELQREQAALLEQQREQYRALQFRNPFAENVFEDLTVSQRAAEFQAQQGLQQRADILQGLRGAAGTSGIAGLAQTLANQGQLQAQAISAGIAEQERANQAARAQGQLQVQAGQQMVQQFEADRQATLLGMQLGQTTGANLGVRAAQQNLMGANLAAAQGRRQAMSTLTQTLLNPSVMSGLQGLFGPKGGGDND